MTPGALAREAAAIETRLAPLGTPRRAVGTKAYLKSSLRFLGEGDSTRFERYADPLLEDKEFFIRKAIGWLLREAATRETDRVVAFVAPRARRLSGVTCREATRMLPARERQRLNAMRQRVR